MQRENGRMKELMGDRDWYFMKRSVMSRLKEELSAIGMRVRNDYRKDMKAKKVCKDRDALDPLCLPLRTRCEDRQRLR